MNTLLVSMTHTARHACLTRGDSFFLSLLSIQSRVGCHCLPRSYHNICCYIL